MQTVSAMNGAQGMLIVLLVISILSVIVWPPIAVVAAIGIALYIFSPPSVIACAPHGRLETAAQQAMPPSPVVGEGLEAHLRKLEAAKEEQDRTADAVEMLVNDEFARVNAEIRADVAARPEDHTGAVSVARNELINVQRKHAEFNAKLLAPDSKNFKTVHDPTGLREQMRREQDELTGFYNTGSTNVNHVFDDGF